MENKNCSQYSGYKIVTLMVILITSIGWMNASAQTKKVVLKDFTFYPFVSQKSVDNPLLLPYESSSSSIAITIEENEDFETVEDFLKYYISPVNKSVRVESVNGLSVGWVIENNEEDLHEDKINNLLKITNNIFRDKLVTSFHKRWEINDIVWPSRTGKMTV